MWQMHLGYLRNELQDQSYSNPNCNSNYFYFYFSVSFYVLKLYLIVLILFFNPCSVLFLVCFILFSLSYSGFDSITK